MRFGELSLGLAVLMVSAIARADQLPEPQEDPPAEKPVAPEPAGPAEPEPTFAKPKAGPTQEEIDDMTPLPPPPAAKVLAKGFAVGLQLGTSTSLSGQLGSTSKLGGGFWFGRRGPTVTWGIGFELTRASHYDDSNQTTTSVAIDESYTTFVLEPNLSIVFARSKDLHTELLGRFVLGYGFSVYSDNDETTSLPDVEVIRFGFGPQLRHWISDEFAIGAHVGPTWEHRGYQNDPGTGATNTITFSSWEIDGAIEMTAVF